MLIPLHSHSELLSNPIGEDKEITGPIADIHASTHDVEACFYDKSRKIFLLTTLLQCSYPFNM